MNLVFGITSYFPSGDDYHMAIRKARTKRCSELLLTLTKLWPNIDIIIIAQNWKDYEKPDIKNRCIIYRYPDKLGIAKAKQTLREIFLSSAYDHLIMLDDDAILQCADPSKFTDMINEHPDDLGLLDSAVSTLSVIPKTLYTQLNFPSMSPEQGEGFVDILFLEHCKALFPQQIYHFGPNCIKELSKKPKYAMTCPSTWASERAYDWEYMTRVTDSAISAIKHQVFGAIDDKIDVVIPYVDAKDPEWKKIYLQAKVQL